VPNRTDVNATNALTGTLNRSPFGERRGFGTPSRESNQARIVKTAHREQVPLHAFMIDIVLVSRETGNKQMSILDLRIDQQFLPAPSSR